jgi:hypothetical protein
VNDLRNKRDERFTETRRRVSHRLPDIAGAIFLLSRPGRSRVRTGAVRSGEAANGISAVEQINEIHPDIEHIPIEGKDFYFA